MKLEYPTIRFGRTLENSADAYKVLSKSPGFPDEAESLFRQQVCQCVEWTVGDNDGERYPDSFLFWKLSGGSILVSRLTDAGCDSRGRPHSIGIVSIVVEPENTALATAEFLARLIATSDWSGGTLSEESGESRHVETLEQYLPSHAKSLLVTRHSHFRASGIDRVCSPDRPVASPLPHRAKPVPPSRSQSPPPVLTTTTKQGTKRWMLLSLAMLFTLFVLLAVAGYLSHTIQTINAELQTTTTDLERAKTQLLNKEEALAELQSTKQEIVRQLTAKDKELEQEKSDHLQTQTERAELQTKLADARRDADTGLKEENETLRQENQQQRTFINNIRQWHERLSRLLGDSPRQE